MILVCSKALPCPVCGDAECIRLHAPTHRVQSGRRRDRDRCAVCNRWRVTLVYPEYNENGEVVGDIRKCQTCTGAARSRRQGLCGFCGEVAWIEYRRPDGLDVGQCCYNTATDACHDCHQHKPVAYRLEHGQPICEKCYRVNHCPKR